MEDSDGCTPADPNERPAQEFFIESIAFIKDVYKAETEHPAWLWALNALKTLKRVKFASTNDDSVGNFNLVMLLCYLFMVFS